jgi:hypothetical protein
MTEELQKFLFDFIEFKDWDAGKWKATGFASAVETALPPWLIIVFAHEQPGCSAFAALRSKVGREDEEELLVRALPGTSGYR